MNKTAAIFVFTAMLYVNALASGGVFTPRTTAPDADDPRFTTENPFYNVGLGMPNCTAYAWGRAYEILGERPPLNIGNARYWFYNEGGFPQPDDRFERGQTPRLGAIAVWGASELGPFGHVAVVEGINADGTVNLSESFWGGEIFAFSVGVDVHHNEAWRIEPVYRNFLGFIYLCSVVGTEAPPFTGVYYENYVILPPPDEPITAPTEEPTEEPTSEPTETPTAEAPTEAEPTPPVLIVPPSTERRLRFVIGSTVFTDGEYTRILDTPPFIENDRTMVPLRVIGEALGATNLAFDQGVVTFHIGLRAFTMTIGEALPGNMGTPILVDGRTFVPLGYIVEAMGAQAVWDGYAGAVYVFIP